MSTSSTVTILYEPTGANCSGTAYTKSQINAACTKALQLASQKKTLGRDKYPHAYNDYEKFSFPHALKPYLEFPILASGEVYAGGAPNTDRVVIGSIAKDFQSAVYCGLITHHGEKNDAFMMCRDDTMNLRGGGDDVPGEDAGGEGKNADHHGHGHKERKERELVDRIEMEC